MARSIDLRAILPTLARANACPQFGYRIEKLRSLWSAQLVALSEIADFIPIRLVTLFENAIRFSVKQLVDHGNPFNSRGIALLAKGSIKDSASLLLAVHTDQVSLGDLVAHAVPTNDIESVISAFELLIGEDFKQQLSTQKVRQAIEIDGKPDKPIILDLAQTYVP